MLGLMLFISIFVPHITILVFAIIFMFISVGTSLALLREERTEFRFMLELMKEQHVKEMVEKKDLLEIEDLDPFTEKEHEYIKHRNRRFRSGVLIRVFLLGLAILMLYFVFA